MENNYSPAVEDVLKAYGTEAEILYVIHNKNYLHYQKRGHLYTIPVIVLSTITGVLSFNQSIQATSAGQYTIGGLNILCGIITTVYKFLNYSNFENQHRLLAIEYLHLFEDIRSVLSKHPKQRPDALKYLEKVESKRQDLFDNFSIIHDSIRREFKSKHKTLSLPLKLDHISTIHIYGREKDEDVASKTPSIDTPTSPISPGFEPLKKIVVVKHGKKPVPDPIPDPTSDPALNTTLDSTLDDPTLDSTLAIPDVPSEPVSDQRTVVESSI